MALPRSPVFVVTKVIFLAAIRISVPFSTMAESAGNLVVASAFNSVLAVPSTSILLISSISFTGTSVQYACENKAARNGRVS